MADDELKTKLREAIDMAIFSDLLEMDHDEQRGFSSSAVYKFIEAGENTVEDMVEALPKRGLLKLASLGDFLKKCSSAMGVYKVLESCERILENSAMRSKGGSASEGDGMEDSFFSRIEEELCLLKDSLCLARRGLIRSTRPM